jgi:acetamidase/formamidase
VKPGDSLTVETRDSMGYDADRNPLPESMKWKIPGTSVKESNPTVGPVYVEGAAEGDLLAVHIDRIRLTRDFAISKQTTHFGSLTGEYEGHRLLYNAPIETIFFDWMLDHERGLAILEVPGSRIGRIEAPLEPFIGSIGVAPRFGRVETTLTPGEFGGNMDCVETREGATLYLPVWVEGAYLAFGDVHARQGDGEVNGTALEVTAEVTLTIDVVRGSRPEWPRLESEEQIMVIASTRPLMDCVRAGQVAMLDWLTGEHGYDREEAWQVMGQVGTMRIGNVVDPNYTVVVRFPKRFLPAS